MCVKMRVVTTNLAIRFYKSDGWSEPDLMNIVQFSNLDHPFRFFDDGFSAYWVPRPGVKLDIDKLLKEYKPSVSRTFDDYPNQTDKEHLETKNW